MKPSQISRVLAETTNTLFSFVNASFFLVEFGVLVHNQKHLLNYLYLPKL